MNVLRKIAGVLLLIIGGILLIGTLATIPNGISESIKKVKESSMGLAFAFGTLVGIAIFGILIFFSIKYGLKLIKKKSAEVDSIDEIGI
jgi:hypothetical protein